MPMLTEVAVHLQSLGIGTMAVDLYGGTYPATPDNVVSLFEHPNFEPEDTFAGTDHIVLNLQVLVRNLTYPNAETKSRAIWQALHRFRGTLSGVAYKSILARGYPASLGIDENKRHRWSCNYIVRKAVS